MKTDWKKFIWILLPVLFIIACENFSPIDIGPELGIVDTKPANSSDNAQRVLTSFPGCSRFWCVGSSCAGNTCWPKGSWDTGFICPCGGACIMQVEYENEIYSSGPVYDDLIDHIYSYPHFVAEFEARMEFLFPGIPYQVEDVSLTTFEDSEHFFITIQYMVEGELGTISLTQDPVTDRVTTWICSDRNGCTNCEEVMTPEGNVECTCSGCGLVGMDEDDDGHIWFIRLNW